MARELGAGEYTDIDWLPELVLFESFNGVWEIYLETIYKYFKQDFIYNKPVFRGRTLALKRYPMSLGKEATFWHLISEGKTEDDRIPDMRRCERIRWPKPIISNSDDKEIKCWKNTRKGQTRICLWLEKHEYLIILAERKGYFLLWTGYIVTRPHQKRKLQKEYETYQKQLKP